MENRKAKDYKVVQYYFQSGTDVENFEKTVLEYLLDGYSLAGGVTLYQGKLFQAMVKYEELIDSKKL